MVEVDRHSIVLDLDDHTVEAASVFCLQGDDVSFIDVIRVELPVLHKCGLGNIEHQLLIKLAVSLIARNDEIELVAFAQRIERIFKRFEHSTKLADKHKGMLNRTFFRQLLFYLLTVIY